MEFLPPDHVYQRALGRVKAKAKAASSDPMVNALERLLLGDDAVPNEIAYAYRLFSDNYQREVMEAFLIAGAQPSVLEEIFDIPKPVTEAFATLFFDVSVFVNRLELESYVRYYAEDEEEGDWARALKQSALEQGLEYLRVSFGRDRVAVDPKAVVDDMLRQSFMFMKVASMHPLDSQKAKEARQWTGTLMDAMKNQYDMLQGRDTSNEGLLVRLEMVQYDDETPTISPSDIVSRKPLSSDDEEEED